MEKKKKADSKATVQPLKNAKHSLPGQQIGLYGGDEKQDVKDMVKTLNPDSQSMKSRG